MRWPDGETTKTGHDDGALLPIRGLSAARLGADDVLPVWERLGPDRIFAGVAGPGPASSEATDPVRASRRAGRVLEGLRASLQKGGVEPGYRGFTAISVETDERDPVPVLGQEVQVAAATLHRADGRLRLHWTGDARVYFLDAVALCRLTFEDSPAPGLQGPSSLWARTVDVRPPTAGLVFVCTHGAHGHFAAPWLFEGALVSAFERSTSWRGFAEQVRFALERETKNAASFAAIPWGARDFQDIRDAVLGPGGQRLSDLAARQASAGGAGWLNAWLSMYGPIHERWRWTLFTPSARAQVPDAIERLAPAEATSRALESDRANVSLPDREAANTDRSVPEHRPSEAHTTDTEDGEGGEEGTAPLSAPEALQDRPPNWGGVANALTRLSEEWNRAAKADRRADRAMGRPPEVPAARPAEREAAVAPVVPFRLLTGGAAKQEVSPKRTPEVRQEGYSGFGSRGGSAALAAESEILAALEGLDSPGDPIAEPHAEEPDAIALATEATEALDDLEASAAQDLTPEPGDLPTRTVQIDPEYLISVTGAQIRAAHLAAADPDESTALLLSNPVWEANEATRLAPTSAGSAPRRRSTLDGRFVSEEPSESRRSRVRRRGVIGASLFGGVLAIGLLASRPWVTSAEAEGPNPSGTATAPESATPAESAPLDAPVEVDLPASLASPVLVPVALPLSVPPRIGEPETALRYRRLPVAAAAVAVPVVAPVATPVEPVVGVGPAPEEGTASRVARRDIALAVPARLPFTAAPGTAEFESRVYLVLRRGPAVVFQKVSVLPPGARVVVNAKKAGTNWVRVEYRGREAWASTRKGRLFPVAGVNPLLPEI